MAQNKKTTIDKKDLKKVSGGYKPTGAAKPERPVNTGSGGSNQPIDPSSAGGKTGL
ncbi:MAG: hypothetical protein VYC34_08505 [Planctomycetota bacterium]|nr:hypothetical protein [Planctomycetota bacterium]